MRKTQALLLERNASLDLGDAGSESYSSNSSFTDSYSDSSDLANWEEHVAPDGSLFYAEYLPQLKKSDTIAGNVADQLQEKRVEFVRSLSLRMMGKKAARRQQQQQARSNGHQQSQQQAKAPKRESDAAEHKFCHIGAGRDSVANYKQLELMITAADRFRYGRRSTPVESILGFRVIPFPDQPECLMMDGFVHDMPALSQHEGEEEPIQRGDWFKSLDEIDVRASNVNELLLQFTEPTKVCLKFQGPAKATTGQAASAQENTRGAGKSGELKKVCDFGMFSVLFEQLHATLKSDSNDAATPQLEMPFALLILPPECYQQAQHKDSLYYYPETVDNFLYKTRGSFLTLNAVLSEELQTTPVISKLLVEQTPYYVSYRSLNGFLVLFAYAATYQTLAESNLRSDELINYMRFAFPTLCLDNFANANASAAALRQFLHQFCDIQRVRLLASQGPQQTGLFEELFKESRQMCLPKEAQLRIFDALSEMEAMDYRNWNDEPLTTHREFFMYGSILYYDHFLLASQMPVEVRTSVESFLRCRGIFDFIAAQSVKELYVWQEILLPNATGRFFLTICSRSHLILAVILKIFDAPDLTVDAVVAPSLFYIEEIQETLDHLIQCGIESLAMFWSVSNKRPEVLDKPEHFEEAASERDASKLEAFLKHKLTSGAAGGTQTQRTNTNEDEAHLCASLGSSSIHSLTPSEDDSSKKRLTAASNANVNANAEDSDSGSDWDNFAEQNTLRYSSLVDPETQSQMNESLWKEINNVVPVKISAGWKNSIFYYVYVDVANGSILCPLKANSETFPFLREMRRACHQIHDVLQQTKHFRQLLAQETSKPHGSKGLLAIKEHSMTIQVHESETNQAAGELDSVKGRFVVIGRLFFSPTKEVYVCHRPNVPQNMVEMAFRLSFFSMG